MDTKHGFFLLNFQSPSDSVGYCIGLGTAMSGSVLGLEGWQDRAGGRTSILTVRQVVETGGAGNRIANLKYTKLSRTHVALCAICANGQLS